MTTLGSGQSTDEFSPLPYVEPSPLDDDDAWEELPGRPLRQKLGPFSIVLCAFLIAGGFFYAGVRVEKGKVGSGSSGPSAASIRAAITAATGGGGAAGTTGGAAGRTGSTSATTGAGSTATTGAAGAAGAFAGAAAGTRGTIVLIDGPNVYLREADQTVVKVATNAGTTISVTSTGTVANLHPGDTVRVTGPTGSDGTIAATSLTDTGATAGGGGGFGGGAAGGFGGAAGGAAGGGGAATGAAGGGGAATGAAGGATGAASRPAGG